MVAYRMRFLWPDEIDADRAHYAKLEEKWGDDASIDDMEPAFGSFFWQMPERIPCVRLTAQSGQEAVEEAATLWRQAPKRDGRVGYLIFHPRFPSCVIELNDFRPKPEDASKAA